MLLQAAAYNRQVECDGPTGILGGRLYRHLLRLLCVILVGTVSLSSFAASYVWGPSGGGNSRWSRDNNWAAGTAPIENILAGLTTVDITFTGNLKLTPILDGNYYVHSLSFDIGAGAFTINPQNNNASLTLGAGGITNNSANSQALNISLILSNSQTWSASLGDVISAGNLNLGGNVLTIAGGRDVTISGAITGSGSLVKQGLGSLLLDGTAANGFTGGVIIESGSVTAGKNTALGTGPLQMNGGTLDVGTYTLGLSAVTLQGGVINGSGGGITSATAFQTRSGTVNSVLGGNVGLQKTTTGTVILSGANNYTGDTEIYGGHLVVNNATGSGTGLGNVLIHSGGLLTGTGFIAGMVTNNPGGTISAGDEIGVLTLGSTVWFGGATNRWDISDASGVAGVGWDLLNINGTLTINATSNNPAIIDLFSYTAGGVPGLAANYDPNMAGSWLMVQASGGIIFAPGEDASTALRFLTGNFLNDPTTEFSLSLSPDGRELYVTYVPVPEPSKGALISLGFCAFIYARRFQRNWRPNRRALN